MDIKEEKKLLRKKIKAKIKELPKEYKETADYKILAKLLTLPEYQKAETVFCFVGTKNEINTRPFLEQVLADGKVLAVPLCTGQGIMVAKRIYNLSELKSGAYDILEPEVTSETIELNENSFAVIPCLSCDHKGNRLGHGGGYYDRYFTNGKVASALVCWEKIMEEQIPTEETDHCFPIVVTEDGIFSNN
jgi:5-formyltetrahydrofolate cyclo-ligase